MKNETLFKKTLIALQRGASLCKRELNDERSRRIKFWLKIGGTRRKLDGVNAKEIRSNTVWGCDSTSYEAQLEPIVDAIREVIIQNHEISESNKEVLDRYIFPRVKTKACRITLNKFFSAGNTLTGLSDKRLKLNKIDEKEVSRSLFNHLLNRMILPPSEVPFAEDKVPSNIRTAYHQAVREFLED